MVIWNLQKKLILSLIFRCDNKSFVIQNVFLALTNIVKKSKTTDYCCKNRHPGCFQRPPHCLMIKMKILWLAWQNLKAGVLLTFQKVQLQNLKSFKIQFNLVFVCLCMHRNLTHYYFPGSCHCWIDVLNQYQHNKNIWRPSSKLYHEKQKFCLLIRFCSVIVSENPHKSFYWIWT